MRESVCDIVLFTEFCIFIFFPMMIVSLDMYPVSVGSCFMNFRTVSDVQGDHIVVLMAIHIIANT